MTARADPAEERSVIRDIRPGDVEALADIVREAEQAATWSTNSYAKLITEKGVLSLVAERHGQIIGFLIGRQVADEAEILNLALKRQSRRRGQGGLLLQTGLDEFRRRNAKRAFLEVRNSNSSAIAFYSKHGFVPSGKRKGYYRNPDEDALCMEQKLTDPAE